mmetsp:Transcript_5311/g.19424  ORF Transcript_5311/g.19424 Transcript_5311/m.19424 type:complete len:232 (-) Transcript_5311:441-1136(-)
MRPRWPELARNTSSRLAIGVQVVVWHGVVVFIGLILHLWRKSLGGFEQSDFSEAILDRISLRNSLVVHKEHRIDIWGHVLQKRYNREYSRPTRKQKFIDINVQNPVHSIREGFHNRKLAVVALLLHEDVIPRTSIKILAGAKVGIAILVAPVVLHDNQVNHLQPGECLHDLLIGSIVVKVHLRDTHENLIKQPWNYLTTEALGIYSGCGDNGDLGQALLDSLMLFGGVQPG